MKDTKTSSQLSTAWLRCSEEVLIVSFGEKLKQLRQEKGWSQDELAFHANIDGRQVSRYENDRVTPSIEVAVKIAKAFDVSLDYLLLDNSPRKPLRTVTSKLSERLLSLDSLSEEDEKSLLHFLDAIDAKNKFKAVLAEIR
jgi:transcriptional regulator with XRE-family HTH domain